MHLDQMVGTLETGLSANTLGGVYLFINLGRTTIAIVHNKNGKTLKGR
jgi:hypothetical protein